MPRKLGIIAGGGTLPRRLIDHCRTEGRDCFVVALEGHCDEETVTGTAHAWCRLGAAGELLSLLQSADVHDVVLAGRVRRPSLRDIRPDGKGLRILTRMGWHFLGGDDALLRVVAQTFEREGFRIVGVHEVLHELLAPAGALGRVRPDVRATRDIAIGIAGARDLGARDLGQAVVVRGGQVVSEEDAAGTDALIRRSAGPGGVLVKMRKPQQDDRMDLPTIGPDTVRLAAEAGLAGIAVEAGRALIVDRAEVVRLADAAGLFVLGADGR